MFVEVALVAVPAEILDLMDVYISEALASVLNRIKTSSVPDSALTALRYFVTEAFSVEPSVTVKPAVSACFLKTSVVTGVRAEQPTRESTVTAARIAAHNFNIFFNVKPPINRENPLSFIIVRLSTVYKYNRICSVKKLKKFKGSIPNCSGVAIKGNCKKKSQIFQKRLVKYCIVKLFLRIISKDNTHRRKIH